MTRRFDHGEALAAERSEREATWEQRREKILEAATDPAAPLPKIRVAVESLIGDQVTYNSPELAGGNRRLAIEHGVRQIMAEVVRVPEEEKHHAEQHP